MVLLPGNKNCHQRPKMDAPPLLWRWAPSSELSSPHHQKIAPPYTRNTSNFIPPARAYSTPTAENWRSIEKRSSIERLLYCGATMASELEEVCSKASPSSPRRKFSNCLTTLCAACLGFTWRKKMLEKGRELFALTYEMSDFFSLWASSPTPILRSEWWPWSTWCPTQRLSQPFSRLKTWNQLRIWNSSWEIFQ